MPARAVRAMSGLHVSTAWARLRQRVAERVGGDRPGATPFPSTAPPSEHARETLIRRIHGTRAEPGTAPREGPERQAPDLEGRGLADVLVRGVGYGALTPEGLEWLLRRQRGDAQVLAGALGLPPPMAPGQERTDPPRRAADA